MTVDLAERDGLRMKNKLKKKSQANITYRGPPFAFCHKNTKLNPCEPETCSFLITNESVPFILAGLITHTLSKATSQHNDHGTLSARGSAPSPSIGHRRNNILQRRNNSCLFYSACSASRHTLCPQTLLSESITHTPQVTEQFIIVQLPVNVQQQAHCSGKVSTSLPRKHESEYNILVIPLKCARVQTNTMTQIKTSNKADF